MKLVTPNCPRCGRPAKGTLENILGIALINIEKDGTFEYSGETDVDWDCQETALDDHGNVMLVCDGGCPDFPSAVEYDADDTPLQGKGQKPKAQVITLDQPIYARVLGKAIRIRMVIAGTTDSRVEESNKQIRANPDLSALTDTGSVTYLADKHDLGVPVTKMEVFRT